LLDRLFALETFGIKLGLENITRLCAALGYPQRAFRSLHVGGTNGKGSVTAMAHTALIAAGIRAARFTSPHLADVTERFVIGDEPVNRHQLEQVTNEVLDCADGLRAAGRLAGHPTFFEATTAIAFELFRRAHVEVAVIEVGLGGRFDATNVISPIAAAITSIGIDHERFLGHTLDAIAYEKAGIIKPGIPLVIGALPREAHSVVTAVASGKNAAVIEAAVHTRAHVEPIDGASHVLIATPADQYGPLTLALRGDHQVGNAVVAVRLLEVAREAGIAVSRRAIERGLANVAWPGRLELIRLTDGKQVLLDAAHNADGARALAAYLHRSHPERPALVLGMMRDKNLAATIGALMPAVSSVIATAADTPRAIPARELAARIAAQAAAVPVLVEPEPGIAVSRALERSATVCVAGSIFIVGAVRDELLRRAILR
jgi:dihydrofolate synthase/folylpolyglutamate synthase